MATWTLDDNTNGKNGGYLQINKDGRRVVDAFPYARGADSAWVRAEAQRIVDVMNKFEGLPAGGPHALADVAPKRSETNVGRCG